MYISRAILYVRDVAIGSVIRVKGIYVKEESFKDFTIKKFEEKDIASNFRIQNQYFLDEMSLHELRYIMNRTSLTQVVIKDEEVIGFCAGRIKINLSGLYGRIDIIAIKDGYHGIGLGKRFILNEKELFLRQDAGKC